jgi:hypothetical protein
MKKNLVIQYYIDVQKYSQPGFNNLKPSPMETYSRNSFQRYCEKFNLDYLRITEPKLAFKHPTWERFDLWVDRSWYDKYEFRQATPETAKFNQRVNPDADRFTGETICKRFVQPGVMMLNRTNTEFMLPWISKYKQVKDNRIDDGMFLNGCIVDSNVPLLDMERMYNFKNNGEKFDYDRVNFLHCAGGKKHKKHVKIWPKLAKIFPEVKVDLSGLED